MNKLPAMKYLVLLLAGIIAAMLLHMPLIISTILLCISVISLLFIKDAKIRTGLFLLCVIISGSLRLSLADEVFHNIHNIPEGNGSFEIIVLKQKANPYYIDSYIVKAFLLEKKIKATLYAKKELPVLEPGKRYVISNATWKPISGERNPYNFNYLTYAKVHGLSHNLQIRKSSIITETKISKPLTYLAYRVRNELSVRILCVLGIEKGSLVNGLLFGMKSEIPSCIADLFRQLGVSHLLAVSGLHVGLIMLIVYQILLSLSIPRIPRVISIAIFLTFYCFLTGGSPSVIRSSLMSVMLLFSPVFQRKYSALNAVAASAVILLLINPFSLLDLGFQFSYSAVFGILIAYPRFKCWFGNRKRNKISAYMIDMLTVSLSAALFTSPVAVYYFNSLQLASMLLNIIVIPLTFCVMICAILGLPGLFIHGIVSDTIFHALDLSLDVFRFVLRLASRSDIWTLHISSYWKPLFFGLIIALLILVCIDKKKHKLIALSISMICCSMWFYMNTRPEVIHPDIKKGDMVLIRNGKEALIVNTGWQYFNYNDYERTILPVLDHWGTKDLTLLITDWSLASESNMGRLLRNYPDGRIIAPSDIRDHELDFIEVRSDTSLVIAQEEIMIIHENKMLSIELNLKNNLINYDGDTLYVNGKSTRMKHFRLIGNMLVQRE